MCGTINHTKINGGNHKTTNTKPNDGKRKQISHGSNS